MTQNLRHVVPSVTHKLRTVHEIRVTQCHNALNNFVVTSRTCDTSEIFFGTFHGVNRLSVWGYSFYKHDDLNLNVTVSVPADDQRT